MYRIRILEHHKTKRNTSITSLRIIINNLNINNIIVSNSQKDINQSNSKQRISWKRVLIENSQELIILFLSLEQSMIYI